MVDLDDNRLEISKKLGATQVVNSGDGKAVEKVLALTGGRGVDVAVEAVGVPATFDICQDVVAAGGHLANVGVHGKPVTLKLEKLWIHNVTITTGLVDTYTTPMLLKNVTAGRLQPRKLITHDFALDEVMKAYDVFGNAAKERALKVVRMRHPSPPDAGGCQLAAAEGRRRSDDADAHGRGRGRCCGGHVVL
jgi:alcohol dehydrogenase